MNEEKKKKQNPLQTAKNLWFMLQFSFKYAPFYTVVTLMEALGRGGWHIIDILFVKYLFDAIENGKAFQEILFWAVITACYNGGFELFNKWRVYIYVPKIRMVLHERIQGELHKKARSLDLSCYDDPEFYNDFIWAIRESDHRVVQIMENFSIFINRVIASTVILGLLASMDRVVTAILLVTLVLGFFVKKKINQLEYLKNEEVNPINRKLSYIERVFYLPDYAKELRQGKIAEHLQKEYRVTMEKKRNCIRKHMKKLSSYSFVSGFLMEVMPSGGVVGYLIFRYLTDPVLTLGSFSASINASFKLYWTIDDISNYLTKFHEHGLYIEKVRTFLAYEPTIKGTEEHVPAFEKLTIRNLSFAYPFAAKEEKTLDEIELTIKKGEKIAFVGYNGAGKTTLTKLLMRLYDSSQGEILYNGRNIKEYQPEKYREHIGAVFQDYQIFAATIAENVLGGEYTETEKERVMEAIAAASFGEKLKELPKGIHSQLTTEFQKDGVGLSGGEAQKIAIARVFAKSYELIMMDEPSSALDPIAEYELNQSILKNAEQKTVIFISHRLSTTRMADRIYMFERGKIVEYGSHEELMTLNGKYANMYQIQAKKYQSQE